MTRDAQTPKIDPATAARLHQLEGFFHVGRHQGYARAAAAVPFPITEPALHHQVRKLEAALGVRVLERAGRRMVLTAEGRALHEFVAPFFEGLPGLLRAVAAGDAGTLAVAAEPLYTSELVAPALARLAGRTERLGRIVLRELDAVEIASGIVAGDLDAGVGVADPAELPDGIAFEPVAPLGLCLLLPPGHPLERKRGAIGPADLAGHRFVTYEPGTAGHAVTDRVLRGEKIALEVAATASSATAMEALVQSGLAPAFVPVLRPRARRKTRRADGTVEVDLTDALKRRRGTLPMWGLLLRDGVEPAGLLASFCEEVRAQASGRRARR